LLLGVLRKSDLTNIHLSN